MAEIITNLHPDGDKNTNLYPNIKKENIPSKSISTDKLDDNVLSLIGSLKPSGTDTSTNILAFTSNKGIYVATDNGHWYYWNGSAYADGGVYQTDLSYDKIKEDLTNEITARQNAINAEANRAMARENEIEELFTLPTEEAVNKWLDNHPEATTTVQDSSLSINKFTEETKTKVINRNIITYDELVSTINDTDYEYLVDKININIPITSIKKIAFKTYVNGTFILNNDMFTTSDSLLYLPNFESCIFIGNGFNISAMNKYIVGGNFTNCIFIDCGLVETTSIAQSQRFVNCRFVMNANHIFIKANEVIEARFSNCRFESDNKSTIIEATRQDGSSFSAQFVCFDNCIAEGQIEPFVKIHDGVISFINCYFLQNKEILKVLPSNLAMPILNIVCNSCKISTITSNYAFDIDETYYIKISNRTNFECNDCVISSANLINTNRFNTYNVNNAKVDTDGYFLPNKEISTVYPFKNSIVDFTAEGTCVVKKFPCLFTFDSSEGGWHTNLYFVSLSYNNTPQVICLSDPTKKPTATYDSSTGYVNVTLHSTRGVYDNTSAIYLMGQDNNLVNNNHWRSKSTTGYDV